MDALAIAGLSLQSINAAIDAARTITGAKQALSDADLRLRLAEVITALADAKVQLASLQSDLASADDWQKRKEAYSLEATPVGGFVMKFKGEPAHFACIRCMESKNEIHPLQGWFGGEWSGELSCPACKTSYPVKQPQQGHGVVPM